MIRFAIAQTTLALWTFLALLFTGCGGDEEPSATSETEPADTVSPSEPEVPSTEPVESAGPEGPPEACARVIVVAWRGAVAASDDITRSETEARARAEQLLERLSAGEDFAELARAESDASSSGPRGGLLGTYTQDAFPAAHEPIRDAIFALSVDQTSDILRAPYGWVIARRCPVEKVHTRHILVRYRGARRAGDDITRSEDEARALALDLRRRLDAPDADFAALAREHSEDDSAERGGDLGPVGRGLLAPEYEQTAFGLGENEISQPVHTEFGFHIIQRLRNNPDAARHGGP